MSVALFASKGTIMTRGNARELAVHLIYAREFTGEEPEKVVAARLEKEYYSQLADENEVYSDRPSKAQVAYLDNVVSGVANRAEELNEQIQKYSIGWDISRISKLAENNILFLNVRQQPSQALRQ